MLLNFHSGCGKVCIRQGLVSPCKTIVTISGALPLATFYQHRESFSLDVTAANYLIRAKFNYGLTHRHHNACTPIE